MAKTDSRLSPDIPPFYFLAALIVEVILGRMPGAMFVAEPVRLVGIPFVLGGLLLGLWGSQLFAKAGTPVRPFETASTLVTTGPFRFSRNPMYLGMVLVLFGMALLLGRLVPFLVPFLFAWLISVRFIRHEEAQLYEQFGDTYAEYTQRVRRWI